MPKRKESLTLTQLRDLYKTILKKDVPNAFKNDFTWISKKVAEITKNTYVFNNTTNNIYLTSQNNDDVEATNANEKVSKKQKTDISFSDLLSKKATYEDFFKFKKLKNAAHDEEKEIFVKKARNMFGGGEAVNSLNKIAARKQSAEQDAITAKNNVVGLFFDEAKRNKVKKLLFAFDELCEKSSGSSSNNNQEPQVEEEYLPLVYEKIARYLNKQSVYLKAKVMEKKIKTFVEAYETSNETEQVTELKAKIKSLEDDLKKLPANVERFAEMRKTMEKELKDFRTTLLQLETGTTDVKALDFLDGASQLY